MRLRPLLGLCVLLAAPAMAATDPSQAALAPAVKVDYDKHLGGLFDWFHRNPELSYMEARTAARMAKELRAIPGIEVTEKVGGTGVVGVMRNGAGPTVLVRAARSGSSGKKGKSVGLSG